MHSEELKLPRRVLIKEVISGRGLPGSRVSSWDLRTSGLETVSTCDGEKLLIYSNGAQSTPAPGWILLLTGKKEVASSEFQNRDAFTWTLYGIKKQ